MRQQLPTRLLVCEYRIQSLGSIVFFFIWRKCCSIADWQLNALVALNQGAMVSSQESFLCEIFHLFNKSPLHRCVSAVDRSPWQPSADLSRTRSKWWRDPEKEGSERRAQLLPPPHRKVKSSALCVVCKQISCKRSFSWFTNKMMYLILTLGDPQFISLVLDYCPHIYLSV